MEEDEALVSYTEKWGSISVYDAFITYILLCRAALDVPFVWHYTPSRKPGGRSLTEWKKLLGRKKNKPCKGNIKQLPTRQTQKFNK